MKRLSPDAPKGVQCRCPDCSKYSETHDVYCSYCRKMNCTSNRANCTHIH